MDPCGTPAVILPKLDKTPSIETHAEYGPSSNSQTNQVLYLPNQICIISSVNSRGLPCQMPS